ncbi:MAG TPA: DMT family transporter [Thermoplasmata archaeon]|nr:DMT family transporter [Thermoplasmata archaeon]
MPPDGAGGSAGESGHLAFSRVDLALLALVALVWGSAYVFIKQGIVYGASPLVFAAARYGLSAVAFVAIAAALRIGLPTRRAASVSALLGGVFIIGGYGGLLYWGEQYTTGGYAAVLASTAPILTVAFAYGLLPAERLGRRGLAGMALALLGAVVLVAPQLFGSAVGTWPGPLFVGGAYVSAALGTVLLRRYGGGPQGLWQIGAQFGAAAALLFAVAAIAPVPELLPRTTGVVLALVALVALSSVVGYFGYFRLHHRVGPVRANLVAYLAPIVGLLVGSGLFGEAFTLDELIGFVIVIAGVTLVLLERARPGPSAG